MDDSTKREQKTCQHALRHPPQRLEDLTTIPLSRPRFPGHAENGDDSGQGDAALPIGVSLTKKLLNKYLHLY